ncbi:hypothetical protein Tco_0398274 [Tanacetum coccineum]
MVDSSSHKPSSPEITPKEEHVTLDKPESPNPFLPADQVEFIFEEIAFTTNNEVALLYPSHPNSYYFREVSDFISKWEIKGDIGINTFRNALRAHYLPHSSGKTGGLGQISNKDATILYCLANGVKVDYARLIWEDIIHKLSKKTREKVVPYPRFISLLLEYMMPEYDNEELIINPTQVFSVHNWALKPNQTEGPPFTDHMKAICNLDVPMDSKDPQPFSQTKEVSQGKKPGAKSGLRRKQSSKHTSDSKTEASKSKTGQSEKETQSSSAKDKSPSHPLPPTPMVGEMHKEAQQAAGGPTSLGATSEDGAHLQLSSGHEALANSTIEADPGLSAPNDSIPSQQDQTKSGGDGLKTAQTDSGTNEESRADEISKKIKLEDLSDLLKDTRSAFFILTPQKLNQSLFQMRVKRKKKLIKIKTLMLFLMMFNYFSPRRMSWDNKKPKAEAEVASLKAMPSYPDVNQLTNLLLKQHVKDMEIELPGDVKEVPTKLDTFTSTISSLTSQKQLKTLDSLPSLLNKVTETLNKFDTVVENASEATTKDVPFQQTRMEYLDQTKKDQKIDFNKSLKEQDPLNELNDLANKKGKRTSDSTDHSRSTKKHKSSIQHEEEKIKTFLSLLEGLQGGKKIALCEKE